jgi:hypothetical protein
MYRTHNIRITNLSTRGSPSQRKIEDTRRAFASTVGKKDTLPATAIRKITFRVSLEEGTIQEQDASKEAHQGEHSELSRTLTTPSLVFPSIKSHLEEQNK